jgi:branched-chain amino acid transport system ATP-binding protein
MLEISGLSAGYGKLHVIENLDLSIPTGRRVAIFGRNGAGKSTLVNTILRTVDTYGGDMRWNGHSLRRMRTEKVVRLGVGLVPQSRGLFYHQTVEENLRLGAYHAGVSRQVVYERIDQMFTRFPALAARRALLSSSLSGGEQQMRAIAKVLMRTPKLLLLDEPSIGLAPRMIQQVAEAVRSVEGDDLTLLITEQNVEYVLPLVDEAHILEQGRIVKTFSSADGGIDKTTILHEYLGGGSLKTPVNGAGPTT